MVIFVHMFALYLVVRVPKRFPDDAAFSGGSKKEEGLEFTHCREALIVPKTLTAQGNEATIGYSTPSS